VQIDILIAVQPEQIRSAVITLKSVVLDCDVDCRLAVFMHGGTRKDFSDLDEFLAPSEVVDGELGKEFEWSVAHERSLLSLHTKLEGVGQMKINNLAVLVEPGLAVNDPKWFGKMQQTFLKDPRNMLTIVLPFQNSTLHPNRALPDLQAKGPMIMGGVDFAAILGLCLSGDVSRDFRYVTKGLGGNRWTIESVRHLFIPCLESEKSELGATLFE